MNNLITLRNLSVGAIVAILILTILEFPAPIGFEVRPQDNVSLWWLGLFLAIMASQIAAIPLLYKKIYLGAAFGMLAALLNIVQIAADQAHMMQPEVAPLGYVLLEDSVGVAAVLLAFFCWRILKTRR